MRRGGSGRLGGRGLALALLLAATACAGPQNAGTIARLDTTVTLRPDGSVDIVEDYQAGPAAVAGATVTRVINPRESDSLELVSAEATGVTRGAVTVDAPGRPLRVHWRLPSAEGLGDSGLRIHYRAYRILFLEPPRAYLHWPVLDPARGFSVAACRVTLALPDGWPFYAGTGMAEAGWTVSRTPTGIVAEHGQIGETEAATLLADTNFHIDTMAQSDWQTNDDRQRNLLPSYVAGALFMIVIGVATLVVLKQQYPLVANDMSASGTASSPADRLMVARGLRLTAWVTIVVAAACGAVVHIFTPQLGVWIQLIPGSMVLVSVGFLVASVTWRRRAMR